jgi:serine protease AprX
MFHIVCESTRKRPAFIAIAAGVALLLSSATVAAERRPKLSSDLTKRISAGSQESTPVIVPGTSEAIEAIAARHGVKVKKRLQHGSVLEVTPEQLLALSIDPSVPQVSGDAKVYRMAAVTSQATGADQVRSGIGGLPGYTGRGIGVAVIDTGISNHKALKGRVVTAVDFTGGRRVDDEYGHGTHVAGIIASDDDPQYAGMAPGAHIIAVRALGADGTGDTSDVIAAIDWVIANRARYRIRIINLSLSRPVFESYRQDPLCQAAQRAVDAGLVVVAAAGNHGKTVDGTRLIASIGSPGNLPAAITVGASNTKGTATTVDDVMATYSSSGPTPIDGDVKPDLVAPGNRIVSAVAQGSFMATTYPERVMAGHGRQAYMEKRRLH